DFAFPGRDLYVKIQISALLAPAFCFVLLCIAEQYKAASLHTKKHTHRTQLTL
ncbi:unnamed protein product, partial [Staurois parvus]